MEKLFLNVAEVASLLGVSKQKAYKIIREMNEKLSKEGFLTLRGKISRKYFMEQIYKAEEVEE